MTYKRDLDFVHITEAGLEDETSPKMRGFTPFRANYTKYTSASVIYVRDGYVPTLLRISETEESTVESEFIHLGRTV